MDDDIAAIGTANLDNRSMRINFEMMTIMTSPDNINAIATMLTQDFKNSSMIDVSLFQQRSFGFRLLTRTIKLAAPIL